MQVVRPPAERALLIGAPRKGSSDAKKAEEHLDELLAGDRFAPVVADLAAGVIDPYEAADRLLGGLLPEA